MLPERSQRTAACTKTKHERNPATLLLSSIQICPENGYVRLVVNLPRLLVREAAVPLRKHLPGHPLQDLKALASTHSYEVIILQGRWAKMEVLKLKCPECKSRRKMKKTKGGFYACQKPKMRRILHAAKLFRHNLKPLRRALFIEILLVVSRESLKFQ